MVFPQFPAENESGACKDPFLIHIHSWPEDLWGQCFRSQVFISCQTNLQKITLKIYGVRDFLVYGKNKWVDFEWLSFQQHTFAKLGFYYYFFSNWITVRDTATKLFMIQFQAFSVPTPVPSPVYISPPMSPVFLPLPGTWLDFMLNENRESPCDQFGPY